jgi:alkylation response protein AidB-like acyl-CoA dehydrogenase
MPDFAVDRRDMDFLLYEQLGLDKLSELPAYEDFGREIYDHVLNEAYKLGKEVLFPANAAGDKEGCSWSPEGVQIPASYEDAYKKFCAGDWVSLAGNDELGGQGLPHLMSAAIGEICCGANTALMMYPGLSSAAGNLLTAFGTDWMKKTVVTRLFKGEWQGTMALTEPQAGSAVGDLTTSATPAEDGDHYLIEGNKIFISCAEHGLTENFAHLVLARIPGDPGGTKGISIFLVPKVRFDKETGALGEFNNVHCTGIEHKMGINGSATCALSFGDDGPCHGYLIGEERKGIRIMFSMMNEARIGTGVQGLGLMTVSYEMARAFAKERVQGTHPDQWDAEEPELVKIGKHPDVRRMLLDMKATVEACRALLYYCAHQSDIAHAHPDEKVKKHAHYRCELLTPICKAFVTDQAFRVAETAIQVHGGYGYCTEYGVEQYCRDIKIGSIYEGTNGIQALDLLGRKMGMKGGMVFMGYMSDLETFLNEKKPEGTELADAFAALGKARGRMLEVAMKFMTMGQGGDRLYPVLSATPFLEMFGYVVCGHLLLEQAVIAMPRLVELWEKHDAETAAERHLLCRDNAEARFYEGKFACAEYWAAWKLPRVHAIGKGILSENRSPLATIF